MEKLLLDHLLKGSKLIEKWCPACHFPLLKKGVTPLLFSPASVSVQGNSSFDSGVSEQEDGGQWIPTDGIPYCLSCETHVVTNEFELAFAAEQMSSSHKMSKKGSLLHLMQAPSRPSSPDKANQIKASGKPQLSVFISSTPSMDETMLAPTEEAVKLEGTALSKDTVTELNTEYKESEPGLQNTEMERVKAMLIFTMQSRADVSVSTAHQSPLSPLSDAGLEPESETEKFESNDSKAMTSEGVTEEVTKNDEKDDNVPAVEETLKFDSNDAILAKQPDDKLREENGNAILDSQDIQHADYLIANHNKSIDVPMESHTPTIVDYNIRREIATKVLARKMVEGYSIQETACVDCGMPLMEKNKTVLCFVCPEFARKTEEQQEDINLTEQLRLKTLAEKNRVAEETKEKLRKAREQRLLELDEERLKASVKKMEAERTTAAEEKLQLEKLLATLKQLEDDIDHEEKAAAHESITALDRELISDIVNVPSKASKERQQEEEQECSAKESAESSAWSAEMKELEDEARFLEVCDVKLAAERSWLAEKKKLEDEVRIFKDITLSSEKKILNEESKLLEEVSKAKEEKKLFAQKVLDEIHAAEQEAQKEKKLQQEQHEGGKQFHREKIQKTHPEESSQYLQKLEKLEKREAEWLKNLDFIAAENAERKRVAAEKERLVAEEEIRKEQERLAKEQEELMRQQEEIAAEEQKKREYQATDETRKKLEKINTDVAWFEEMSAITEKARKLEVEASVQLKADSEPQKIIAERDVAVEEEQISLLFPLVSPLDNEKKRVEEARRLKQEKILKDKAAIEKARKDRLEAARRRVEENAKAEAALMAKLEEEAAAAKLAINKSKKATTPSYNRGSPLVSFFCSDTSEENDEKTKDNKWETKRTKAHASMSSRLNQGWKKKEDACRGKECGAMPLLTFRNSSPYCIVCGGCGSGKDGEYKEVLTPLTPRSPRRKKGSTTPPNSMEVPKLFDFVKVQPVVDHSASKTNTNQPNVFPLIEALLAEAKEDVYVENITEPDVNSSKPQAQGAFTAVKDEKKQKIIKSSLTYQKLMNANDTTAEAREAAEELIETVSAYAIHDKPVRETFLHEKSLVENRIAAEEPMAEIKMRPSKKIGTLMLAGWSLLDASCSKCDVLLVARNLGASELCVNCDHDAFRKAGFNFDSEKQSNTKELVISSVENGSTSKAKNDNSSLLVEIPAVDETTTMMPSQQEREDGEQGREESSRAPLRDTSTVPLPRRPMRASTPKASNEMLELFDVKASNNTLPGVKKSLTPRTPVRSKPRLFDDDACFDRQLNSGSRKQLENIGSFQEGNYHSGEAKLKQSPALDTLSAIMSQINTAKAKLSTPRNGEAVDRPMSDQIEIAELIEQLAAAALAARRLEEFA